MKASTNKKAVKVPIYSEFKNGIETVNFDINKFYETTRKLARGDKKVNS